MRRGSVLGNPHIAEARALAIEALRAKRPAAEILALVADWRRQGKSLRAIAADLNRLEIRSPRGKQWHASSVRNVVRWG